MGQNDVNQLRAEYESLRHRLADLGREGDEHAAEMRCLFGEAKASWDKDDRVGAKVLSEQGHRAKARSEAANAEAHDLSQRLRTVQVCLRQAEHETARRNKLAGDSAVLAVHGARLVGFERTRGWDASNVQVFLSRLPSSPFLEINLIEYVDVADEKGRAGVTNLYLTERSRKADIQVFRHPVDIDGADFIYYQAWTLVHEYGHVVFDRVLDTHARRAWGDLYNERLKEPDLVWISNRARTSLREDFSECLAAYSIRPNFFARVDREKYDIIDKIYRML
jgi:hypothetical protein